MEKKVILHSFVFFLYVCLNQDRIVLTTIPPGRPKGTSVLDQGIRVGKFFLHTHGLIDTEIERRSDVNLA